MEMFAHFLSFPLQTHLRLVLAIPFKYSESLAVVWLLMWRANLKQTRKPLTLWNNYIFVNVQLRIPGDWQCGKVGNATTCGS